MKQGIPYCWDMLISAMVMRLNARFLFVMRLMVCWDRPLTKYPLILVLSEILSFVRLLIVSTALKAGLILKRVVRTECIGVRRYCAVDPIILKPSRLLIFA